MAYISFKDVSHPSWYVDLLQDPKTNLYSITSTENKAQAPEFVLCDHCSKKDIIAEFRWLVSKLNEISAYPEAINRPITLWAINSKNEADCIKVIICPDLISFSPELIKFVQDYLWIERFGDHDWTLNLLKNLPSTQINIPDLLQGL